MRRVYIRGMAISFFVIIISFFNFERLTGSECIRAIHVVTLLVCGMAIGIFLMNLFRLLRAEKK
jgi:high-affinity K+ transport system ATPase subunit B